MLSIADSSIKSVSRAATKVEMESGGVNEKSVDGQQLINNTRRITTCMEYFLLTNTALILF